MARFNKLQHFCVCEGLYWVCACVWVNMWDISEAFLGCLSQFLSAVTFRTSSLTEPGAPRSSYTGWPESSGGLLSPSPQCWDYRHLLPHPTACGCWETELQPPGPPVPALFLKILHVFPRQFFARVALNPGPHRWQARSLGELPWPKSYSFKFWIFGIKNVHHFKIPFIYSGPPSSMRSPLLCRTEMIFFVYSSMRSKENTPSLLLSTLY